MKKIVSIGDKEYTMKSSAYTQFKYKNDTGRKMLQDIQKITELGEIDSNKILSEMDDVMEIILRLAYVMIDEADSKQVNNFEEFLKQTDGMLDNQDWIMDVITLATSPLSRGLQNNIPQVKE